MAFSQSNPAVESSEQKTQPSTLSQDMQYVAELAHIGQRDELNKTDQLKKGVGVKFREALAKYREAKQQKEKEESDIKQLAKNLKESGTIWAEGLTKAAGNITEFQRLAELTKKHADEFVKDKQTAEKKREDYKKVMKATTAQLFRQLIRFQLAYASAPTGEKSLKQTVQECKNQEMHLLRKRLDELNPEEKLSKEKKLVDLCRVVRNHWPNEEETSYLLGIGVDANICFLNSQTKQYLQPAFIAVWECNLKLFELLMAAGKVDLDARNAVNQSAGNFVFPPQSHVLLAFVTELFIRDRDQYHENYRHMIQLLVRKGANVLDGLRVACSHGEFNLIKFFLERIKTPFTEEIKFSACSHDTQRQVREMISKANNQIAEEAKRNSLSTDAVTPRLGSR